ncbi:unnamed protein product [Clonostachys rosea]|uniref:Uncharacterized protein n=1 Tax=Bionectria ochroleuca TaxID=29856 RepID=A0ABY6U2V2_BIOOC|nr:unnamed protein product [Clonostachys rosea]
MSPVLQNGCPNPTAIEVLIIVGQDGHFTLIEHSRDDTYEKSNINGQAIRRINIEYSHKDGHLRVPSSGKKWRSSIHVMASNEIVSNASVAIVHGHAEKSTVVTVPKSIPADTEIEVTLGVEPSLQVLDYTELIRVMLIDFQITLDSKDHIWKIVSSHEPIF